MNCFRRVKTALLAIPERNKTLILSLVVGVVAGLAAVVLEECIALVKHLVDHFTNATSFNWLYLVTPGIGMLLSMLLVKYVVRDNIGHGVTKVLLAISRNESKIRPHNMWSSLPTSALTIGFGGSVGAEAPIVYTGAAIGSNFARYMGLSYKNMTIMLGCGAAAAVAGIFKAPLAGLLFTMEILLFNISMSSMLPLMLAAISATVVAYIFRGQDLPFQCALTPFSMGNIPFYMILGVVGGFGSLYFSRVTLWLEDKLGAWKSRMRKCIVCAISIGVLIFLFPMLYGEGYGSLSGLLNSAPIEQYGDNTLLGGMLDSGFGVVAFFVLVFLFKVVAMTLTNAGGGVGGTFGPTLFEGAILGFVVARTFNLIGFNVPEQNFALVGMAAMMAGVMQAPMTAIFLIAEVTGGYELLVPLILASAISFGTTRIFEKYSIYAKRIAQSGDLLTHDNDQAVLTLLKTSDLVRDKYPRVSVDASLGDVVRIIADSTAAVFAVVDDEDHFKGLVDIDTARSFMFKTHQYKTMHVSDFMQSPAEFIYLDEPMTSVMRKFDRTGAWRLPVIDQNRKYYGFISRSRLLSAYREELKIISQD